MRARRFAARLALSIAVFLLAGLAAELGHRGWLAWQGRPYVTAEVERRIREESDPTAAYWLSADEEAEELPEAAPGEDGSTDAVPTAASLNVLHPYTGSEKRHDMGGVLAHFRGGLPKNAYVVLFVGGSVATALAAFNAGKNGLFARLLRDDPRFRDKRVMLLNYAHVSYKQPQQVMRLAYLLSLGYAPDAVVNIDGFNELVAADRNASKGVHPVYPSPVTWELLVRSNDWAIESRARLWGLAERARDFGARSQRWGLHRSSILGNAALDHLLQLNAERARIQLSITEDESTLDDEELQWMRGPKFDLSREELLDACARIWFESSLSLQALCESRGVHYVHVLQPSLNDSGSKVPSGKEKKLKLGDEAWISAARDGYPLLRQYGEHLPGHGISFFDATRIFADEERTIFRDACHMEALGRQLFTEAIAEYFLSTVEEPN